MIDRVIKDDIIKHLFKRKVIIVFGPRQVGKTTLLHDLAAQLELPYRWLNCDEDEVRLLLENANLNMLRLEIGANKILFIDEAQRVNNIGLTLKLLVDNLPDVQIIVTGSSALDLGNQLQEPLTGRKIEYKLFPISSAELVAHNGVAAEMKALDMRLIYGSYPAVINDMSEAKRTLLELTNSYLYKDILALDSVRKSAFLNKMLVALAHQIGSEVSNNELAKLLGIDSKTVERYLDLLEKCFVIFRLPAYSRNIRTELKKSKKVFFYDLGVRNAVINNFAPLELRDDKGKLWENFVIMERMKRNSYKFNNASMYFWRTTGQQEIDYLEEKDGVIDVFEMKSNPRQKATLPNVFANNYNVGTFEVITPENYLPWVL